MRHRLKLCFLLQGFFGISPEIFHSIPPRQLRISTPTAKAVGVVALAVCAPRQLRVSTPTAKAVGMVASAVCAPRQLRVSTPTAKAVGVRAWFGRQLRISTPPTLCIHSDS